jgi:ubiquinone/menaquinone biosynthesis C-methylase UbiE/DNA-binding transcriptional ArsR family regulator
MSFLVDSLKLIADHTRLRLLRLLQHHELSVAELQEILGMGQSRISTQLSSLKRASLVDDRRVGKNILYTLGSTAQEEPHRSIIAHTSSALPEASADDRALQLTLRKRTDKARLYFDQLAGKFGRTYVPGRSWKSLAEALIQLIPAQIIVDLGAGEGTLSQLLAQRAEKVIAIDNAAKMVEFGRQLAREHGYDNLEYRLGEIESPPVDDATADLVIFSQALHHAQRPAVALREAHRMLKPGGRLLILDLLRHDFEQARELYADVWLGFAEAEIDAWLSQLHFHDITTAVVDRESEPPFFQTLLASARKVG